MTSFLDPLLRKSSGDCTLVNDRTGVVLADRLIPAFDSATRRTGLLQHGELPEGSAMIIAPSRATLKVCSVPAGVAPPNTRTALA